MSLSFLNVGCGPVFIKSERWMNIDFGAKSNDVIRLDLRRLSKTYPALKFDGIYSCHVIEHLSINEAKKHLGICFDRLNEGGVVRMVTPDFRNLVAAYLVHAENGEIHLASIEKLLLLEQCVRSKKGGWFRQQAKHTEERFPGTAEYLYTRCGEHVIFGKGYNSNLSTEVNRRGFFERKWSKFRSVFDLLILSLCRLILPVRYKENLLFTDPGERHLWIFDQDEIISMANEIGFSSVKNMSAGQSDVFDKNDLDYLEIDASGNERKGNYSMYLELVK